MTRPSALSHEDLFASAQRYARAALTEYYTGDRARTPLEAGTSLEHLVKACLAKRSPTLLVDLKNGDWPSLQLLAGVPGATAARLRTIGMRVALTRAESYITSVASPQDLKLLVDLRDGVVHVAGTDPATGAVLLAFVQHVEACVADYGADREAFWGPQQPVVDALLTENKDRVTADVTVRIAAAAAAFGQQHAGQPPELLALLRQWKPTLTVDQAHAQCPACRCTGVAVGRHEVEYDFEQEYEGDGEYGEVISGAWVSFTAYEFLCRACGLHLDSPSALDAAGIDRAWEDKSITAADLEEADEGRW